MQGLKIVSQIEVNGVWVNQKDLESEIVGKIVETAIDRAMRSIGGQRIKTACLNTEPKGS